MLRIRSAPQGSIVRTRVHLIQTSLMKHAAVNFTKNLNLLKYKCKYGHKFLHRRPKTKPYNTVVDIDKKHTKLSMSEKFHFN